jgi:osmotically-inducible protein OsmY
MKRFAIKPFASFALAAALAVPAAFSQTALQVQASAQHAVRAFKNVHVAVQDGVATLSGSVKIYADKVAAANKLRHVQGVSAIRNQVAVDAPAIPDRKLTEKLQTRIAYGLLGYVPVAFQTIGVHVQNGVVTLNGNAAGPIAASDAVAIVENTKGVKDVIDNIHIDPVSMVDEQIRRQEYRAIYGDPMLNQYAIDPEKPIRIQVENGHVTLYGYVQRKGEKDAAGIRANTVPGVFSVTNNIQVAGSSTEKSPRK